MTMTYHSKDMSKKDFTKKLEQQLSKFVDLLAEGMINLFKTLVLVFVLALFCLFAYRIYELLTLL